MSTTEQHGPMAQFEITRYKEIHIAGYDLSFTNSALMMVIAVIGITLFTILSMRGRSIVPGRWQSLAELSYEFIAGMIRENIGTAGLKFFPFVFSLFMFVLFLNLIGMVPYSFTVTSHIAVTFVLAFAVFLVVTIYGFMKHGIGFLKLFAPAGLPIYMYPIITPIEIVSYLTRPLSLSVRLFANMLAGHTMLKVFAGFVIALGFLGVIPLVVIVLFTGLEFLVAVLQAYVFAILTCIYLNDAENLH